LLRTILYPITLLPQGGYTGTQDRWQQPNVPFYLRPPHYVTSRNIHLSILRRSTNILDLSTVHTVPPARLLILTAGAMLW